MSNTAKRKRLGNKDWETASFAALMFSIREYKDRFSETHGVKLNSRSREIDVRIIDTQSLTPSDSDMSRSITAQNAGVDSVGNVTATQSIRSSQIDINAGNRLESRRINHAIAYFFEKHNLIELKNPRENLNIDVFWKGISYATQYKSSGYDDTTNEKGVNIKPMRDITLTFLRITKPERLLQYLEAHGYSNSQKFAGVYYISGITELKIQIVVGAELEGDEFIPLRVQKENASEEDIRKFVKMCGKLREQSDKDMADTIMQISVSNNKKVYEKILEEEDMCKALEELMADRIERKANERYAKGRKEGWTEGRTEMSRTIYERLTASGMSPQQASSFTGWNM